MSIIGGFTVHITYPLSIEFGLVNKMFVFCHACVLCPLWPVYLVCGVLGETKVKIEAGIQESLAFFFSSKNIKLCE